MRTNIEPTSPPVEPGVTVQTYQYHIKNFRLNKVLEAIGTMGIALLECDSNNASSSVSARDSRRFQKALDQIEREWNRAKEYRDAAHGKQEMVYSVNFPRPREIQRMKNTKLKSVQYELFNVFGVILGSQSAEMQVWVGPDEDDKDIDDLLKALRDITTKELGNGKKDGNGKYNVGIDAPNFNFMGQLSPSIAGGESPIIQEPSKESSPSVIPDAPDTSASGEEGSS